MTRAIIVVFLSVLALGANHSVAAQDGAGDGTSRTVLLELFTSQGCSSCPPADRLLTELVAEGSGGVEVVALSYHVDYWNYIGWTDPFSSPEWSARQRQYAHQLAGDRAYTPQLVIDGVGECVGSSRREVKRHIAAAARRLPGAGLAATRTGDGRWRVSATLPADAAGGAQVRVALFERELTTAVRSGENARRTLHNDNVVRRLTTVAELAPGEAWQGGYELVLDPAWRADRLGVAIFVQDEASLEVLASTAQDL